MSNDLTEEEMRRALFGLAHSSPAAQPSPSQPSPASSPKPIKSATAAMPAVTPTKRKSLTPKLQVTLRVSKQFEGVTELFIHEVSTLSTLTAQIEAEKEAKKKFKYVELVKIKQI